MPTFNRIKAAIELVDFLRGWKLSTEAIEIPSRRKVDKKKEKSILRRLRCGRFERRFPDAFLQLPFNVFTSKILWQAFEGTSNIKRMQKKPNKS